MTFFSVMQYDMQLGAKRGADLVCSHFCTFGRYLAILPIKMSCSNSDYITRLRRKINQNNTFNITTRKHCLLQEFHSSNICMT